MSKVAAHIPTKWYQFGIQIGILKETLDIIEWNRSCRDALRCFSEVFDIWEKQVTKLPYTWSSVLKILREPIIGGDRIAEALEEQLNQN